jgi:dephospho-CoA kinase
MINRCAIFLKADPLMKKDVIAIKTLLTMYNEVDLILDRKWQKDKYLLNYTERCEIIKHDLKAEGIENYNIFANDISKYDSAVKAGVKNVAFIYDNYTKPDEIAERYAMTKRMIPDVNILLIPIFDECIIASNDYLYDIILEDQTHRIYKKFISDFAYIKTKFKLLPKIGLTGNKGCDLKTIMDVFKERDYEVVDIGQMISLAFQDTKIMTPAFKELERMGIDTKPLITTKDGKAVADEPAVIRLCLENPEAKDIWFKRIQDYVRLMMMHQVLETNKKVIVLCTTLIYELKLDWMFKYIITAVASNETIKKNLIGMKFDENHIDDYMKLYIPMKEKMKKADFFIDTNGDKKSIERNTINVINKKLEADF